MENVKEKYLKNLVCCNDLEAYIKEKQKDCEKGSYDYKLKNMAIEIIKRYVDCDESRKYSPIAFENLESELLNGADNWMVASEGGSFFAYDIDIIKNCLEDNDVSYYIKKEGNKEYVDCEKGKHNWLEVQGGFLDIAFQSEICSAFKTIEAYKAIDKMKNFKLTDEKIMKKYNGR